ncbi:beta family protein [Pseudomonas kermanshahensis]|uniref:beta family protein n=1 Tax=Pseudomonas kermanshahensis TaxID=2745482 RepID=UPI0023DCBC42|nr:beta family protein [Pseudomonas kermanshahensis]WEL58021.1 beta family protein [Pseudomonas kermanshahensis]
MSIIFDQYKYYPSLRSRPAEVLGYDKLSSKHKDSIIPTFTLGTWPRQSSIEVPLSKIVEASSGRPFMLDLTVEPSFLTDDIKQLKDSGANFKNWREFILKIDAPVIPVIQITSESKTSQIIRQARELEKAGCNKVAFKVREFGEDTSKIISALSSLDSVENAITIIDAGYVRDTLPASLAGCIATINDIRDEVEDAEITVTATSFPSSVVSFLDPNSGGKRGLIAMYEAKIHEAIGSGAAIYGDHGSIHSRVYITGGGRYTPRIDYPLNDAWIFERRPENNSSGYIDAARSLIRSYSEISDDDTWGAEMIREAAKGNIDGMKTPASWIAARVNMHLSKQIDFRCSGKLDDEEDYDDLI